jgi:RNA polymerase sigma-70 factor (ECF subfamily)
MTDMPRPAEIDLVVQVYSTFEALQQTDPTPERAEVLRLLRPLRNMVAHGADPSRYPDDAVEWMRSNMHALISGSLGTASARALRLRSDPAVIADILARSDDTTKSRRTGHSDGRRSAGAPPPDDQFPTTADVVALVATTEGGSAVATSTVKPARLTRRGVEKLVRAAAAGDREARDQCLVVFIPMVQRYCRARMGNRDIGGLSPADVASEVCVAAFTALPSYQDNGGSFAHLLYAIAANKVADAYRAAALPEPSVFTNGIEDDEVAERIKIRMMKLLATLPEIQREVLTLRISVGLSTDETADALNLSPVHVRVLQHRALARLRTVMAADETL